MYKIKYSDYPGTDTGPPDPERWIGPQGEPGPPGPVGPPGPTPEAPTDGQIYGRGGSTPAWVPTLPLTGGTMTGPLTLPALSVTAGTTTLHGNVALDDIAARAIAQAISSVYLGTINLTAPYLNQIFQRATRTGGAYGKGAGSILLTINPTQPITLLEHQLRDAANPGTVLQPWSNSVPPIASGSQVVALSAPAGLYKYLVDLRANGDDASIVSTTTGVMIGELIGFAGQSLAEDFITNVASGDPSTVAGNGLTVSPWNFVFGSFASNTGAYPPVADGPDQFYPPTQFLAPGGGTYPSTFAAELCNRLIALAGVPCAMIGYAVGGTGIDSWLPSYAGPNPGHWTKLVNVLTLAGGNFGTFIWDQGHYETKNGNTATNYYSQLQLLENNVDAAFPHANYQSIIATIPGIGNYGNGPAAIEMVRNTAKQYAGATPLTAYVDGYDATLWTDLVHPSQAGNIGYARHFYRAIAQQWGLLTHGDKGPVITGGTRAFGSKSIVLAVAQTNGGTAWVSVGTPADQFQVFPAGSTSGALALDATTPITLTNPAQITLLLANAPAEPQALDVWYRYPPDTATLVSHGIYDNVTDSDGLTQGRQLWDTGAAINIPAPTITITITTTLADVAPSTPMAVSGTYSAGLSTLDYSFDGITWTAAGATIAGGNFSFNVTSPGAYGLYRLRLRDHVFTTSIGVSNAFLVQLASPPTLPTLSNPIFAFDAYAPRGMAYTNAAMTQQAGIGDTVVALADTTGNGNTFGQTTAGLAPQLVAASKNNMPGLRFTGSLQQFLLQSGGTMGNTMRTSAGYVILCVFTPATLPTAASQEAFAGSHAQVTALNRVRIHQLTAGTVRASRNANSAFNNIAAATNVSANSIIKAVSRWDGTSIKLAVNAQTEVSAVVSGTFTVTWVEQSMIGASNDLPTDSFLDGWIHELRIWNVLASDTDRTNLLTYATSKWGS